MRMRLLSLLALAIGMLAVTPLQAHHSFAAEYDSKKPVTLKGTVTKVDWTNPHVYFYIDVTDDSGITRQAPLMSISIGVLTSQDGPFYDIRELSETAEETRQRAAHQAREQGRRSWVTYGRARA